MFVFKSRFYPLMLLTILSWSCSEMSEKITDHAAGLNGGFEFFKKGLPVNWLMYTPHTVPNADFSIEPDQAIAKEGKQSLKFDVKNCDSTGGWLSPGFSSEFKEVGQYEGEATYQLSFWIKNDGAKFRVSAGGVTATEGEMKPLLVKQETLHDWEFNSFEISIGVGQHLKMELNILSPGVFWIDDIQIEKV